MRLSKPRYEYNNHGQSSKKQFNSAAAAVNGVALSFYDGARLHTAAASSLMPSSSSSSSGVSHPSIGAWTGVSRGATQHSALTGHEVAQLTQEVVSNPLRLISPHPVSSMTPSATAGSSSAQATPSDSSSPIPVEFFFDILSPYSYFAFETLCRYASLWNLRLDLKPVFLSAIMQQTGNTPPAMVQAKRRWMKKDLTRLARYFHVPIRMPTRFQEVMVGSLPVQRLLVAVKLHHPHEVLERVVRNMWRRHWSNDEDILSREGQMAALQDGTGLSADECEKLLTAVTSAEVKSQLAVYTKQAIDYGAFGVPAIVFPADAGSNGGSAGRKELLFGSDRFPVMAMMLNREWQGTNPTQQRPIRSKL